MLKKWVARILVIRMSVASAGNAERIKITLSDGGS